MRWRPKPPTYPAEMPWWCWLLAPIWVPSIAFLAAGFGLLWLKRWLMGPTEEWRPWFAWHPVTTSPWPDEQRVWLEWVERRAGHLLGDAEHRTRPASPPIPPHATRTEEA